MQQLPQYRAVSKSALGNLFWCDVLWGDLGSIRPSADARLTKYNSWESRPSEPQMLFLVWASMNAILEVLKNTTICVAEILNLLGD